MRERGEERKSMTIMELMGKRAVGLLKLWFKKGFLLNSYNVQDYVAYVAASSSSLVLLQFTLEVIFCSSLNNTYSSSSSSCYCSIRIVLSFSFSFCAFSC